MKKRILSLLLCLVLCLSVLPTMAFAEEPTPITKVIVTYPTPRVGDTINNSDITVTTVPAHAANAYIWWRESSKPTGVRGEFEAGKNYYVCGTLTPREGFTFEDDGQGKYTGIVEFNGVPSDFPASFDVTGSHPLDVSGPRMAPAPAVTTYTVSFNMNGHGYQIVAQSVNEGDKAVKPDDPIDNIYNWRFDGWYVDKSCSTKFDFDSAVNTDITLYAKWTKTYSIDINSVSYGAVTANKTRAVAGEKVILSPAPSAGCLLMDLKVTDRNNVECVLSKAGDDYIFTMPDSGVRVSSEFHHILTKVPEASYTISVDGKIDVVFRTELGYRVDHGVISSASDSRYFDTGKIYSSSDRKVTIPYDSSLAGQTIRYRYTVTPVKISPETTLPEYVGSFQVTYAGTAAPMTYAITFDMNGHGDQVADQRVNEGAKATKPADPTASGWTFDGWYADSTFSALYNFSTPVNADMTLYARWTEVTAPKIIESLNVNVTAPAAGNHPDFAPVISGTPSEAASLCKIYLTPEWICADTESDLYNGNGKAMTASDTFEAGKYYAFSIQVNTLDAIAAGWQRSSTIVVTINGSVIDSLNHNVLVNTFGEDIGWLRAAWFLTGTTSPTEAKLTLTVSHDPADGTPVTIGQHISHYYTVKNTGSEPVQLDGIYKGGARLLQYEGITLAPGVSRSLGQSGFDVSEADITQNAQGEKGVMDSFHAAGFANGVAVNSNTVNGWHPLKTSDNPTPTPDKPNTPTNPPKDNLDNSPKTGDARQTVLWIGMLMVSFGTAAAAVQISRKKDQV